MVSGLEISLDRRSAADLKGNTHISYYPLLSVTIRYYQLLSRSAADLKGNTHRSSSDRSSCAGIDCQQSLFYWSSLVVV